MLFIPIYRNFLWLNYNEMRSKLIIAYIHLRLILVIGIYVIKYQTITHFIGLVAAYSRWALT